MIQRLQAIHCPYSLWASVSTAANPQYSSFRRVSSHGAIGKSGSHMISSLKIPTAADLVANAPSSWQPYMRLMRIDKPVGTWLLYWPCTWSIALATPAGELPSLYYLTLFGAGALLMRGAGCVINDMWDKDFDRRVERTKMRPLACGVLNQRQALTFAGGLLCASFSILMQMNWFSVAVGSASMFLVVGYPLAKRYTYWPQFVLGLTFNYGALLGWSAIQGSLSLTPVVLYLAALQWTLIYDTIYAHQDKADDIMIGVKSTALRFGATTKYWLGGFSAAKIAGLGLVGHLAEQTWPYYLGLAGTNVFVTVSWIDCRNC
ncbi:4-hydroxybenzoate polyprenyltransferase, mitochondrial [Parelaphostrongylus tenuis]|uniref:4-hydroxybenzoate polyprenyltransferase, mitochondrial n=1 Tax=Parelaphostrongylus tenuis TaxID=148309 RepID=A0AAD5M6P2_PARTN|nr:4-hydroxybenzoate polyprenyltransferase, mitochondrial [Parelaphostrongylus tenuis]